MAYTKKNKTKICEYSGKDSKRMWEISISNFLSTADYLVADVMFVAFTEYEIWDHAIEYIMILDKLDYTVLKTYCPGKELLNEMFVATRLVTDRAFNKHLSNYLTKRAMKENSGTHKFQKKYKPIFYTTDGNTF